MRSETELIKKIQKLREVKPSKNWVVLTKNQILGEEFVPEASPKMSFWGLFQYKYSFASLVIILVLLGTFTFAQDALPGDFLYSLKKVGEKARVSFLPEEEKPHLQLEYANEKLESLVKVVQAQNTKKVAPIIEEYQANVSEAAKSLNKISKLDVGEIVQKTRKIEENKQKIEALGIIVGETEELNNALAQIVEGQIEDLKKASLSEKQEEFLLEIEEDYEEKNYSEALEKILFLSYPQER